VGGALGLWATIATLRGLAAWQPMPRWPLMVPVNPDATIYLFAFGLALVSGLLFGVVPVRQVMRTDPYRIIKAGPDPVTGTRLAVRDFLLVAQVAICAILVTASLVALHGFERARSARLGFDPDDTLLADTDLAMGGYTNALIASMQKRMIETVAAIPGVTSVAAVGRPPLAASGFLSYLYARDATDFRPAKALVAANRFQISPEYLQAARTRLLAGRAFTWHDDDHAPRVAIVNAQTARLLFGSPEAALGQSFKLRDRTLVHIVGVVENGIYENLAETPQAAVFMPLQQMSMSETWLVVRAAADPGPLSAAIRAAVRQLDPGLPLYVEPWSRQLDFALFPARMATIALAIMGGVGVLLAMTGVFGMSA